MDQSGLSLGSYQFYSGNTSAISHDAFIDFFTTVTQLLGANSSTVATYAEDVWQLEKAFAEVMSPLQSMISHLHLIRQFDPQHYSKTIFYVKWIYSLFVEM